uniref:Pyridoxal-phosphate dependent enzyme n=1 Tax=Eiseniibacteriota bacterium TaxID=2212470 RepID=A0A832I3J9_UNCEI
MISTGLELDLADPGVLDRAVARCREQRILLPTFAELADPSRIPPRVWAELAAVGADAPHPLNLFRVHWWNDAARKGRARVPEHVVLPRQLTGVEAPIVVALGDRFPLIRAHKVLAAYACLAPRLVTGRFDPSAQRAVWPSTGNYCRGGVAISRLLGCRGVAVLPEGMSRERFAWLARWIANPADVVRTPGTESNVREIYDACRALARDPENVILNQFAEFGNHLAHVACTAPALEAVLAHLRAARPGLRMAAFVSASGSAGTLGAGDPLKERHGARIAVAEALECPTLLENGFGEHNIQGIGDKHVPLIHNAMNTDAVIAVSDRVTDELSLVFARPAGHTYLRARRDVPREVIERLCSFGLSSVCNVVAAVKLTRRLGLGPDDAVFTVATDGAEMYASEFDRIQAARFPRGFDEEQAAEVFGRHMLGAQDDHVLELDARERRRIFNLGYFTWVEQQGVPLARFVERREQAWWRGLRATLDAWDDRIREFNARTGLAAGE